MGVDEKQTLLSTTLDGSKRMPNANRDLQPLVALGKRAILFLGENGD